MSVIEHQYEVEQAARSQLQQYLNDFLESLPLGLVWLDQTGCIKKHNTLAHVLLGHKKNIIGSFWRDVITDCLAPQSKNGFEILLKNGRWLDVTTQASPSLERPSKLEQVILLNDVTQTRRLQRHVEQEDRLRELGLISATLSHQLKTPLATSLLYADQLRHYSLPQEKHDHACDQVIGQLQYMSRQVNDLLFFVKGDLPVESSQTVADLVKSVLHMNRSNLASCQFSIALDPTLGAKIIVCHFDAVVGALSNLVTNACEAVQSAVSCQSIQLIVSKIVSHDGAGHGFYFFDVIDHGPGFDQKSAQNLGANAYSSKACGSGIGLRFVRTVAEKHGGHLRYIKRKKGACVGLAIPVLSQESL